MASQEYILTQDNGDFVVNPISNSPVYDFFILANKVSPGLCKITGASNPRKWDERKGQGTSGAGIVYAGDDLAKFTATLTFWLPEHFQYWEEFKLLLEKPKGDQTPTALDIFHPFLDGLGIKSVVCEDYTQPEESNDGFVVTIKFKQYRAPKPAIGKPLGSKDKANTNGSTGTTAKPLTQGEQTFIFLGNQVLNRLNSRKPAPAQPTNTVTGKV